MSTRSRQDEPLCCKTDRLLLFQVNIICLLVSLIGITAVFKHPEWFGN
jgi:hypothetical protein